MREKFITGVRSQWWLRVWFGPRLSTPTRSGGIVHVAAFWDINFSVMSTFAFLPAFCMFLLFAQLGHGTGQWGRNHQFTRKSISRLDYKSSSWVCCVGSFEKASLLSHVAEPSNTFTRSQTK